VSEKTAAAAVSASTSGGGVSAKTAEEGDICEHQRQRSTCKDCGGSGICEHEWVRSTCKDCGGSSICQYQRQRSTCKDCGGSSICEHQRVRSTCKDCGGSSLCEHQRVRSQCKDCGGSGYCEHQRRRSTCKDCGGNCLCVFFLETDINNKCKVAASQTTLCLVRRRVHCSPATFSSKKLESSLHDVPVPGTCSIAPYVDLHIADIVRTRKSSYRDQRETSTRLSTKLESPLEEVSSPSRGATLVLDKSECPKVLRVLPLL